MVIGFFLEWIKETTIGVLLMYGAVLAAWLFAQWVYKNF